MKIFLAPMEGVVDFILRDILTQIGGFDYCVTEFIRVTDKVNPRHIFFRYCPELKMQGKTASGVPVLVQLLGGDPECLAENALLAIELGALGIDLNFGCPAKTVNRHDGGAILLKDPNRIYKIITKVREVVPQEIPVSAKIRLGYDDKELALDNAKAVEQAGASWLTVHARTKKEGYRPPAHWEWIAKIRQGACIPIIANGDICSIQDYQKCRKVTNCKSIMIGRGAVARPDLAVQIKSSLAGEEQQPYSWPKIYSLVLDMFQKCVIKEPHNHYSIARLKQWSRLLAKTYPQAEKLFAVIKTQREITDVSKILHQFTG